jgi:hypothetical protein
MVKHNKKVNNDNKKNGGSTIFSGQFSEHYAITSPYVSNGLMLTCTSGPQ